MQAVALTFDDKIRFTKSLCFCMMQKQSDFVLHIFCKIPYNDVIKTNNKKPSITHSIFEMTSKFFYFKSKKQQLVFFIQVTRNCELMEYNSNVMFIKAIIRNYKLKRNGNFCKGT